jgi:hypothetical protein
MLSFSTIFALDNHSHNSSNNIHSQSKQKRKVSPSPWAPSRLDEAAVVEMVSKKSRSNKVHSFALLDVAKEEALY